MADSNLIALIFLGAAAVFLFVTAGGALIYTARYGARAKLQQRAEIVAGSAAPLRATKGSRDRSKAVQEKIREIEQRSKRPRRRDVLQHELRQANVAVSVQLFYLLSVGAGLLAGLLAFIFFGGFKGSGLAWVFAILVALVVSFGVPRWIVKFIAMRRQAKFIRHFADSVDIIVRGLRSGLPVDECLRIIADESEEPVRSEFRMVVDGIRVGMNLEDALERAYERVPVAELKFFTISLAIQRQTGGNLAETLKNLSVVLRDRHKLRAVIRAISSEARASALILGALPFVVGGMMMVVSNKYMMLLFTDPIGHVLLACGGLSMLIGFVVMKKMVSFEI